MAIGRYANSLLATRMSFDFALRVISAHSHYVTKPQPCFFTILKHTLPSSHPVTASNRSKCVSIWSSVWVLIPSALLERQLTTPAVPRNFELHNFLKNINHSTESIIIKLQNSVNYFLLLFFSNVNTFITGLGGKNRTFATWSQTTHDTISPHRDIKQ